VNIHHTTFCSYCFQKLYQLLSKDQEQLEDDLLVLAVISTTGCGTHFLLFFSSSSRQAFLKYLAVLSGKLGNSDKKSFWLSHYHFQVHTLIPIIACCVGV